MTIYAPTGEDLIQLGKNVKISPSCIVGCMPQKRGKMFREVLDSPVPVIIGDDSSIGHYALIYVDVMIGKNVLIGDHSWIREGCRIGDNCVIGQGVSINYNTVLGTGVRVLNGTHITGLCSIGNDVWIGPNVSMMNDRKCDGDFDKVEGIRIGDNVIIGGGVSIMPGVVIGNNAKIAAGTIVTEDVGESILVYNKFERVEKLWNCQSLY